MKYGYWLHNSNDFGIRPYVHETALEDRVVVIHGPYDSFAEAKEQLVQALTAKIWDYRQAKLDAQILTEKDIAIINHQKQ